MMHMLYRTRLGPATLHAAFALNETGGDAGAHFRLRVLEHEGG